MDENQKNEALYHRPYGPYERFIKRPLDLLISLVSVIVLSPLIVLIAILVKIKHGTPIIYSQERPGLNEKVFRIYKFRTMTCETDSSGALLPDEMRLTRFGKALRSTSLDELPQLINIIKGDMAIVGPRALLTKYLPYYSEEEKHRHDVRPGLTNLVSVKGRNAVSIKDKLKYDIEYVNHISFLMDLRIILSTIGVVLMHKGTELENNKYMEYFLGRDNGDNNI